MCGFSIHLQAYFLLHRQNSPLIDKETLLFFPYVEGFRVVFNLINKKYIMI